jgi:hypothetical protein
MPNHGMGPAGSFGIFRLPYLEPVVRLACSALHLDFHGLKTE